MRKGLAEAGSKRFLCGQQQEFEPLDILRHGISSCWGVQTLIRRVRARS